jgi:flagellar basal-body rod protein FlgC
MSISGAMNTALSGMQAQTTRLGATANNVVNSSTPGYSRLNSTFQSSDNGVQTIVTSSTQTDDGDPATEMTDLIQSEQSYKASAVVFETGADMWDMLMSIKRD